MGLEDLAPNRNQASDTSGYLRKKIQRKKIYNAIYFINVYSVQKKKKTFKHFLVFLVEFLLQNVIMIFVFLFVRQSKHRASLICRMRTVGTLQAQDGSVRGRVICTSMTCLSFATQDICFQLHTVLISLLVCSNM